MIPAGIPSRSEWGDATMIGGNFVSWYGGFDSYMVAQEIGDPISCPSMGRKQEQESLIEDINYLPYMSWRDWISCLSQYNIGVHLMRTHSWYICYELWVSWNTLYWIQRIGYTRTITSTNYS